MHDVDVAVLLHSVDVRAIVADGGAVRVVPLAEVVAWLVRSLERANGPVVA